MNAYVLSGIALGIAVMSGSAGYKIAADHYQAEMAKQTEQVLINERAAAAKYEELVATANESAATLETLRTKNADLSKQVQERKTKIITRKVYSNVCIDVDGKRLLNDAIAPSASKSAAGSSKSSIKVPK